MLPSWIFTLPWEIIRTKASAFSIDPYIVASIIMVESAGNACAIRYEEHWRYIIDVAQYAKISKSTEKTELFGQKTSWGYMQIMGSVAREHRFLGYFPELCLPNTGIEYGIRHFYKFFQKYGDISDAVSAYNAGSPRKNSDGKYLNQSYVNKVMAYYKKLHSYGDK